MIKIKPPLLIVLLGPTASGKTELAIDIAEHLKIDIHNVDSRQLYIGMDIGTAKPTKAQRERVKHYLVDISHPNERINCRQFQELAESNLQKNLSEKKMAFLVGGSGLYLKSISHRLKPPAVPPQSRFRSQLGRMDQKECHQILKIADPHAATKIAPADRIRTQRALEVFYATGNSVSKQTGAEIPPWRILEIGLDPKNLKERISLRTKTLYENGLIEETENLSRIFSKSLPLLQTIGYKEALQVLESKLTIQEAIAITTTRTNQFAKRQRTWFRKKHNPKWLKDEEPLREALSFIQSVLG